MLGSSVLPLGACAAGHALVLCICPSPAYPHSRVPSIAACLTRQCMLVHRTDHRHICRQ